MPDLLAFGEAVGGLHGANRLAGNALHAIDRLALSIKDVGLETIYDLVSFYELKSMLTTARLIVQGSLARKESRGSHFRSDYPETDDKNFKGSFFIKMIKAL